MARARELCPIVQVGVRSMDIEESGGISPDRMFYAHTLMASDDWMSRVVNGLTENVIDLSVTKLHIETIMGKVLIIGAGGVGNVVTRKCAMLPEVFEDICLASRTVDKCEQIRSQLDRPISTARVDADKVPELVKLIQNVQPDLVINVALPYQDLTIMDACLETRTHYMDTTNYEPPDEAKFCYKWQWDYQDRFKEKSIMALLGSGFDPGVTNVFCAYAKKHLFDTIRTIDILDCNAGDHGHPFATNFNPEINIREITQKGKYWEKGQWIETEPLEKSIDFDYPEVGPRKSFPFTTRKWNPWSTICPVWNEFDFG